MTNKLTIWHRGVSQTCVYTMRETLLLSQQLQTWRLCIIFRLN